MPAARRPRVLHIMWNGEIGGTERAVYLLAREQLRASAVAPALFFGRATGPYWDLAQSLGCPTIDARLPHGRRIDRLRGVTELMRPFDIHHFHAAEPLLTLASLGCRHARRIYTHRGGSPRYPFLRRLHYELTGALVRRYFHAFSGNSRHGAVCGARLCRLDPSRFQVTYNGLEFDLLEPKRTRADVREELGLVEGEFVLGTASMLRGEKRVERLLEAVATIRDARLRLLIVGDGEGRPQMERLAQELSIGGQVIFAGKRKHVGDYLQLMDVFCLPSTEESFGNAVVEAMAVGVPTIVFADAGGTVEHIEHGRTGFIVPDQRSFAATLSSLMDTPALGRQIGDAGSRDVRKWYTPEAAERRYRALYEAALSGPPFRR